MPSDIDETLVLEKCADFVDFALWPPTSKIQPLRWLTNFAGEDRQNAVRLLDAFIYISADIAEALVSSAIHDLSTKLPTAFTPNITADWEHFVNRMILTYPTGETPNPSDSGHIYARVARQRLGIKEDQIYEPGDALQALYSSPDRPVVFVDDFLGSGSQFIKTFERTYPVNQSLSTFAEFYLSYGGFFYYCPAVATTLGRANVSQSYPDVLLSAGSVIDNSFSAVSENSRVWPDIAAMRSGTEMIRRLSIPVGISDDETSTQYWKGFHSLGLCLAFDGTVPDATLPLFYWENEWKWLARRK